MLRQLGVWRVAEDDPGSALYAESADATEVLSYMTAHVRHERSGNTNPGHTWDPAASQYLIKLRLS